METLSSFSWHNRVNAEILSIFLFPECRLIRSLACCIFSAFVTMRYMFLFLYLGLREIGYLDSIPSVRSEMSFAISS